jgi:ParB-like chromosome segregation protein Spo0J
VKQSKPNWPATNSEKRAVGLLTPHPRNARRHTKEQIELIARSMREWGFTFPVLIDEDNVILAGHARVEAAKLNNFADVPVIVAKGWTKAQKKAYVLADNQITLAGSDWDAELLRLEMKDLRELAFDESLIGFDDKFMDELFGELREGGDEQDVGPQLGGLKYQVVITCKDEDDQHVMLDRFEKEGLECRALIS